MSTKTISEWLDGTSNILVVGLGGGGDAISAFPVVKYLQDAKKNVYLANVHISSDYDNFISYAKRSFGESAFVMAQQPLNEKKARCIELIVESEIAVPCYSCLSNLGVFELTSSLNLIIDEHSINGVIAIDGGTDALSSTDTNITSIVNDAISLAALSNLDFEIIPLGVIGCCADLEMDLRQFMAKFSELLRNEAYLGIIDFPRTHANVYKTMLSKARLKFPFYVCETIYKAFIGEFGEYKNCYDQVIPLFPFQMFTYIFDSSYIISTLNPFVKIVKNCKSFNDAKQLLVNHLNEFRPERNWMTTLNE